MKSWRQRTKGNAVIYVHEAIPHAIVDRKGHGVNSALGHSISFEGKPFPTVDNAKLFAERKYRKVIADVDIGMQERHHGEQQEELG